MQALKQQARPHQRRKPLWCGLFGQQNAFSHSFVDGLPFKLHGNSCFFDFRPQRSVASRISTIVIPRAGLEKRAAFSYRGIPPKTRRRRSLAQSKALLLRARPALFKHIPLDHRACFVIDRKHILRVDSGQKNLSDATGVLRFQLGAKPNQIVAGVL